jgi:hypothetical protein
MRGRVKRGMKVGGGGGGKRMKGRKKKREEKGQRGRRHEAAQRNGRTGGLGKQNDLLYATLPQNHGDLLP